jgi:Acyl dehydratase
MADKYKVGMTGEFSKTISENDVYLFAGITGDMNPIHIDSVEAGKSMFKGRIAHGILVVGFISNVIAMKMPGPGTIYMEQTSRFERPVRIGDTVTANVTISEIVNKDKNILKLSTVVKNQHGETVVSGYAVVKAP